MTTDRPDTTYVRKPELHAVEMDGELVMMGQEQGEYYGLRDVAASIWQHLDAPKSLEDLVVLISAEYDVSPETCRGDIAEFLGELTAKKLVTTA